MCNEKPEPFRERVLARSLTITPPTSDEKKEKEKKRSTPGAGGGSFATHRDEDALDDPELQAALNQSLTTFKEEQVTNSILFCSLSRSGVKKYVFNKHTIKVCVSCLFDKCPETSALSLTAFLFLCNYGKRHTRRVKGLRRIRGS